MYAFTLERPSTLADATRLAASGAKPLAGGQTMLASMKLRLSAPEQVLDLVDHGVTDFHFYTMNKADLVYAICHLLGLRPQLTMRAA